MILTLPMAKILKDHHKNIKVYFLGTEYTRSIVDACGYSDGFIEVNDFLNDDMNFNNISIEAIIHVKPDFEIALKAKQLKIRARIGTTNRLYHWATCNKLVLLGRRNSGLHEVQLNLKLLEPFGIKQIFKLDEIINSYGLNKLQPLENQFASLVDKKKYNIILHPKSRGNAREWPLENYAKLINMLNPARYKIFISGVDADIPCIQLLLKEIHNTITDISGRMPLNQFVSFIAACNGLVACSTGPLHIAAAVGIDAFGIYPSIKPLYALRWGPIGRKAQVFSLDKQCNICKKNRQPCICVKNILPELIFNAIEKQCTLKLN